MLSARAVLTGYIINAARVKLFVVNMLSMVIAEPVVMYVGIYWLRLVVCVLPGAVWICWVRLVHLWCVYYLVRYGFAGLDLCTCGVCITWCGMDLLG